MSWMNPRRAGERALVNLWSNEVGGMLGAMAAHARAFLLDTGKRPPKRRAIAKATHRFHRPWLTKRQQRRAFDVLTRRQEAAKPARGY